MKSLKELKDSIYEKMNEIRNFDNDDSKIFNEDGTYNYEELTLYLERNKKKSYMQGACMRMIKKYMNRVYGDWSFPRKDYIGYVQEFRYFG